MKSYKPLLIAISLLFFAANSVFAFDCPVAGKPLEELKRATIVFSGKVIGKELRKITDPADEDFGGERLFVKFKTNRWWKGGGDEEVVLRTSFVYFKDTTKQFAEDFRFLTEETYLVYAFYFKGAFGTSGCTRTRKLSEAADDLKALGAGFAPKKAKSE